MKKNNRKLFFSGHDVILTSIEKNDLPFLKRWRNAQTDILRQNKPLTDQDQKRFWKKIKTDKNQILFSILDKKGNIIGYCGIVHIDWENKRGEISFILEPGAEKKLHHYRTIFMETLKGLRQYAFRTANLHKIWTETFAYRKFHISILEQFGFKIEGQLKDHVFKKGRFVDSLIHSIVSKK